MKNHKKITYNENCIAKYIFKYDQNKLFFKFVYMNEDYRDNFNLRNNDLNFSILSIVYPDLHFNDSMKLINICLPGINKSRDKNVIKYCVRAVADIQKEIERTLKILNENIYIIE